MKHQIAECLGGAGLARPAVVLGSGSQVAAGESLQRFQGERTAQDVRRAHAVPKRMQWTAARFEEIAWAALAGSAIAGLALGFWSAG